VTSEVYVEGHNIPRRVGPGPRRMIVREIVNGPASVFMGQEARLIAAMFEALGWETTPQTLDVWQSLPICWDPEVFRLVEFRAVEHYAEGKREGDRSWGAGPGYFAAGVTVAVVLEHLASEDRYAFMTGHLEASAGRKRPDSPGEVLNWEQRRRNHAREVEGIRKLAGHYARKGYAVVVECDWNAGPTSELVSSLHQPPLKVVAPNKPTHLPHAIIDWFLLANCTGEIDAVLNSPSDHQRVRAVVRQA
jgi:hypothetical protein